MLNERDLLMLKELLRPRSKPRRARSPGGDFGSDFDGAGGAGKRGWWVSGWVVLVGWSALGLGFLGGEVTPGQTVIRAGVAAAGTTWLSLRGSALRRRWFTSSTHDQIPVALLEFVRADGTDRGEQSGGA